MKLLKSNLKYEWILLLRNPFLFLPFLFNGVVWIYIFYEKSTLGKGITVENQFYQYFTWIILLNLFMMGIFAVYLANRDRESSFEQLALTYQVKNWQWLTSKWLVAQIYGFFLTIQTVFIQMIWFLTSSMSIVEVLKHSIYSFVQMGGAFFMIVSIGFLIAKLIPNIFSYFVMPALIVASIFLPFDSTGKSLAFDNPRFHLLTPFDFMFVASPYEGIWGIERLFQDTLIHQLAVAIIALFIFIFLMFIYQRNRSSSGEKQLLSLLFIATLIVALVISSIRYTDYNHAFKQYKATGKYYLETFLLNNEGKKEKEDEMSVYYDEMMDDEHYDFSIEKSDLDILLKTNHQLEATNQLTIKNNGKQATEEVFLTLNHLLDVSVCSSKRELNCSIEGDFITLDLTEPILPGEAFDLKLTYGGNILQYFDEGKGEAAFITKKRVFLPRSAGWYPLIGKRNLFRVVEDELLYVKFNLRNTRLVEDFPTKFNVSLQSEGVEVPFVMSIPGNGDGKYTGTTKHGLELIGGNLLEQEVAGIRVISHQALQEGVSTVVYKYHQAWTGLKEWYDLDFMPATIFVLPNNQYYDQIQNMPADFYLLNEDNIYGGGIEEHIVNAIYNQVRQSSLVNSEILNNVGTTEDIDFYDRIIFEELFSWSIYYQMKEEPFTEYHSAENWGEVYDQKIKLLKEMEKQGDENLLAFTVYLYDVARNLTNKAEFNIEKLAATFKEKRKK